MAVALFLFIIVVALIGLAAQIWGVDSRVVDLDPAHPSAVGLD